MKNKLQLPKVSMIEDGKKSETLEAIEKVIKSKGLTFTPIFEDDIELPGNVIPISIDEKISVRCCIKDLQTEDFNITVNGEKVDVENIEFDEKSNGYKIKI